AFRSLVFEEKQLAQKEGHDPRQVCTDSLVKDILSSFDQCELERILPVFFAGLSMFRKFNKWKISRSEVSWTASVIVPILEEFMFVQHERQLNHISWQATQEQPYQPDVIGLADEGKTEVYYGEIKVAKAGLEEQHTDRLRLIIFSKDALDLFERTLDTTPPVISAQVVGRQAVFYYAVKIGNTILHCKLSSFSMPVTLGEFNLHD
ncbi:hypothetical protein BGZ54_004341, partial [Gamsiella multidivaricata]